MFKKTNLASISSNQIQGMEQKEFSKRIQENWTARLRWLYEDYFEFVDGKVTISPSNEVLAGTIGTWILTFSFPFTIQPEGKITVQINNSIGTNWIFDILQIHNSREEGYLTASCEGSAKLTLQLPRPNLIVLYVKDAPFNKEEKIRVVFGDKTKGGPGAQVKIYTQKINFYLKVKVSSDEKEKLVRQVPTLKVLPRETNHCRIIVPSFTEQRKTILAKCIDFDRFNNPTGEKKIKEYPINQERGKENKPQYVYAIDKGLCTSSNPFLFKKGKKDLNLYWGEIHGHAYFSDGLDSPEYFYSYARDVEQLDFCSLTEHDTWLDDRKWAVIKKVNENFYVPGKFVTLLGFEWSSAQFYDSKRHMYGHRCVYYPDNEGKYYSHLLPQFKLPLQLWKKISKFGAIAVPHHPAYAESKNSVWGTNWDYHDDSMEPLVEIYSKHGLSECFGNRWPLFSQNPERFVQKALNRGCKLGFTGGTDTHISRPASNMPEFRRGIRYPKGGLTAIWAKELSRKCIFDALRTRSCYATTGERIIIKFSINDYPMGSIVEKSCLNGCQAVTIETFVAGTERLEKVEIIKNNKIIHLKSTNDKFIEFKYVDKPNFKEGEVFYYLRVTQTDGNMAWSSPIWVTSSPPTRGE